MSSHQSFLHAILENPGADEPRLRYADWLDQTCDPRGEFIRVQCRLARPEEYDPCLGELELRERELLDEFEAVWAEPVAGMVDGWAFQRGFVDEVMVSGRKFVGAGEALCRLMPVQEVHLHDACACLAGVAASPVLERVRFLDLSENRLGDMGLRLLAKSAHLRGARGLNLSATAAGNAGAQALAACPHFNNLEELYLSANNIGDDGARAIAESPYLERLKTLFVNFNCIGARGAEVLRKRFGMRVHL
jgi:uncharacterized protein (TIGR02996 family)